MIEIKDLLLQFQNLLVSEEVKKESIRNIISKVVGVQISSEDIKIKNNTIYLNIKPVYKNELFLKREQILKKLAESLGKKAPKELR